MKISLMIRAPQLLALTYVLAGLLLAGCATANKADTSYSDGVAKHLASEITGLDARYAPGSIQSKDAAEQALAQATADDAALQGWYTQAEQACAEKFFVNSCLIDIKLHRREYHSILQRISIEAKAFQRKQHIEELDKELEQRRAGRPQ